MTDTGHKILQKLKEDDVHPYPKWHFLFRRSVIWAVFFLSIILGSIASASAIFQLRYAEWDLYQHFSHSLMEFALLVIPLFWLIFLLGFTGFAYYYFRRTEQGYRYRTVWVVTGSVALSIFGGGLLYSIGLPEKLEPIFLDKMPFYKEWQIRKQRVWISPDQGLLAGKITKLISDQKMQIEDLNGNHWAIDMANTTWRVRLQPVDGLMIKILGEQTGESRFEAHEIRPWQGKGHGRRGSKRKGGHGKNYIRSE